MKIKNRRAFISGIKGTKISKKEISFLKKYKPWGIILFSRNIKTIEQTKKLTNRIKKIFNDEKYPILIDEEGGRVSRLSNFVDTTLYTAKFFGDLYKKNTSKFNLYFEVYIKQISYLLNILGINLNTFPVLDVKRPGSSSVIGDRSYSTNPQIVSKIGKRGIYLFHRNKISTIIKHIPGHGLAKVDSHIKLPRVNKKKTLLNKIDFYPFKNQKALFAMTAHIVYKNIDPINPATHSKKIIKLIRKTIGFKNLIISDDLSMRSLKYTITENTKKAFTAGCNLVLHCNGKYNEMIEVAENSPKINKFIFKKTSQFRDIIS